VADLKWTTLQGNNLVCWLSDRTITIEQNMSKVLIEGSHRYRVLSQLKPEFVGSAETLDAAIAAAQEYVDGLK
jgi:hypothetical protein